jgi:hypothetical protein
MSRHYSSSPFFKWVTKKFGMNKPSALGWDEWDDWNVTTKNEHPIGWFFTETVPDLLENPAKWFIDPLASAKYYIINRFIDKRHVMSTGLKPGDWNEFETRLLHSMFNELVNFVEVESAWNHLMWMDDEDHKKFNVPWYYENYWLRWRTWRSPEAGLAHFYWARTLRWSSNEVAKDSEYIDKRTPQAEAADEILALYHWWKFDYLKRPEAWVASGFQAFWDIMDAKHGDSNWLLGNKSPMTEEERTEYRMWSDKNTALEEQWNVDETEMMCRLIKIRCSLWT